MFKLEKQISKAVLTVYGYVGGAYLDYRAISTAVDEVVAAGYTKLDFHIHTYGGAVFDGNIIYNTLASFTAKGEIDIYIDGVAASMGSILIMSGTRVHIVDNGFIMIHKPQGGAHGTDADLISAANLLVSMGKNFTAALAARTGKTPEEVATWLDGTDHWFDADQAIAAGLADDKFSAKTINAPKLSTEEATQLGAQALYERFAASLNSNHQTPNRDMNKEDLIKRYALTGVTAQSTDEEVLAAVDAKMKEGSDAAAAANKTAITAATDQAVLDKKITKEQRDAYIARGEKLGLADYSALLSEMKPYQPITDQLAGGGQGPSASATDRKGWTWADYQAKAPMELEEMPKKDPKAFTELFKAEYGVEPELN